MNTSGLSADVRLVILGSICAIVTSTFGTDHNLLAEWNSSAEWTGSGGTQFVKIKTVTPKERPVAVMTKDLLVLFTGTILPQT